MVKITCLESCGMCNSCHSNLNFSKPIFLPVLLLLFLAIKLCTTLCSSTDYSLPGFSIHGIFQAKILECVAISFSRESSQPRNRTHVSCLAGRFFTTEPPGKPSYLYSIIFKKGESCHSIKRQRGKQVKEAFYARKREQARKEQGNGKHLSDQEKLLNMVQVHKVIN